MSKEKIFYSGTLASLSLVIIFFFRNEAGFLETVGNFASLFVLIILGMLLILFSRTVAKDFNGGMKVLYFSWWIIFFWLLLIPFIFNHGFKVSFIFYEGMYHDYRYLGFFSVSFLFISDKSVHYRNLLFRNFGYLALLSGVTAIVIMDKSFSAISSREAGFSLPYYLWWIVMWVYPYLFLRYLLKGDLKLGLWLFILHVLLSLLFLKRAGLVDAGLLVSFYFIFSGTASKKLKGIFITIISLIIGLTIFSGITDLIANRFEGDAENLEEWDRNLEIIEFYKTTTESDRLFGFGANNYLKMTYIGQKDKSVNALHIGFYNLLYKGGYLYLGFFFILVFQILSLRKYVRFSHEIRIGFIMGLVFLIGHSYQFSWSYNPVHFFWLVPILRAIYLKGKIRDTRKRQSLFKRSTVS